MRLGVSTASDIAAFAGQPQVSLEGSTANGYPGYRALGYGCGQRSPIHRIRGISCTTVYFINSQTGTLAGFDSSSPRFETLRGTKPGMQASEAERQEVNKVTMGCFQGFWLRSAGDRMWIDVLSHVVFGIEVVTDRAITTLIPC